MSSFKQNEINAMVVSYIEIEKEIKINYLDEKIANIFGSFLQLIHDCCPNCPLSADENCQIMHNISSPAKMSLFIIFTIFIHSSLSG